jgi:CDP-glucose 4,6-dehydratase
MCSTWGEGARYEIDAGEHPHEAHYLKLDCSTARTELEWQPRWSLERALNSIIDWTHAYRGNDDLYQLCVQQIEAFLATNTVNHRRPC